MFLPLYDGKPIQHISLQWVTLALIAVNVVIHIVTFATAATGFDSGQFMAISFGHVPSVYNDLRTLPPGFEIIPDQYYLATTVTSSFLHAGWLHLAGNMLFLWIFGDNVEDALGHFRFLIFYIVCALAAAWFHSLVFPASENPLIGASGAASGVIAAYLMLHPKVWVWALFLGRIPLKLPAFMLLGLWIGYQLFMFFTDSASQISWASHVGGFTAGLVLVVLLKRRAVPLFDREIVLPNAVSVNNSVLPGNIRLGRQKPR